MIGSVSIQELSTIWAAVSDRDGQLDLHLSDNPEASTALSIGAPAANGQSILVPAFNARKRADKIQFNPRRPDEGRY